MFFFRLLLFFPCVFQWFPDLIFFIVFVLFAFFLLFKTSEEKVLMEEILHKLMKDGVFMSIILSSPQSKLKV